MKKSNQRGWTTFDTCMAVGMVSLIIAFVMMISMSAAHAHHADLSATVGCKNESNLASVFVTATPWVADPAHQVNGEIWIQRRVLGVWQDVSFPGAFTQGGFNQIVREVIVEAPSTQLFRARAAIAWGPNQEYGNIGTGPEISVVVDPKPCVTPVTPTTRELTVATTTTLAPKPSTPTTIAPEAPVSPVQPPTTLAPSPVATPIPATTELAYTGTEGKRVWGMTVLGFLLLILGKVARRMVHL